MKIRSFLFGELTVGRIGLCDWEREQTFFAKRPRISFSLPMPPWKTVIPVCVLILAIARVCAAQTQEEESTTGKSATGNLSWEIRPAADNRSSPTIWLWPDDQEKKAAQLGGPQDAWPRGVEFSANDEWIVVTRHLSSGNFFSFYRKRADGSYVQDSAGGDEEPVAGFFKIERTVTKDQIDRWSANFENWESSFGSAAFAFSWSARLSRRGPDTDFLRCTGWRGVYDLQKHAVIKTLVAARILTASELEEEDLNENYRQLRSLLGEADKESLRVQELAWLEKRDAIKNPQERLEFTTARVNELQDRIEKLRK